MKIALVGAIDSATKKDAVAGTEIWSYNFLLELTTKGHEVTFFGSGDSEINQPLISSVDSKDLIDSVNGEVSKARLAYFSIQEMLDLIEHQDEFDIIHLSVFSLQYYLPLIKLLKKPVVVTVHGPALTKEDAEKVLPNEKNINFALISNSFMESWGKPEKFKVIYNGIRLSDFPFEAKKDDYYFWMGRIAPEKGLDDAINFALKTDSKLIIAGPKRKPEFFNQFVKPHLSDNMKYVGEIGLKEKVTYYQKAKAFLMPIKWDEPFGLVAVEAMACGTPVLAYNRGALSEIITDKVDGLLIPPGDIDAMIRLSENLSEIDPKDCRKKVEEKFSIDVMTDEYIKYYQEILSQL